MEVFHLDVYPKTNKVYAWMHDDGEGKALRHVTVLHIPPAVTSLDAVRAFIVQEFRNANVEAQESWTATPRGHAKVGTLRIRITPDELKRLGVQAKSQGQTVSEFILGTLFAEVEG